MPFLKQPGSLNLCNETNAAKCFELYKMSDYIHAERTLERRDDGWAGAQLWTKAQCSISFENELVFVAENGVVVIVHAEKLFSRSFFIKWAHGQSSESFVYFQYFQTNNTNRLYSIRSWDSNCQPLEHQSSPITSRPGSCLCLTLLQGATDFNIQQKARLIYCYV